MMKSCLLRALLALALLPLATACSTATNSPPVNKVETNYSQQYDFSGARSIAIEPFSRTDPATITVSDAQIERINEAISDELRRKGYEVVKDNRQADLLLTWYLITDDRPGAGSANCPGCDAYAGGRYGKGTLVVDMTDIMRNQAVWRSVLKTRLSAATDPAELERERMLAAEAVFADFPPQ
jgi:hypothetical protein